MFEGEDYSIWSDKMRHHLTSLHKSIWDIVYGVQVPKKGDKDYDSEEVKQIQHFNSQATTILLASLSREEYNKVQGLKSAKEIWDVLKTAHEGDEVTKITKRETIEGELGRFMLHQGEEPQAMYNRLKTLVNQVRNLGSTKWDDHEMVKVILRSLVFLNPTQVQLIRGDPRYKLMSPEEVIGKFMSFELMIKGSKQIIERGATSTPEVQPVAFKATEEKKEESTSSRLPIDASKLNNEEMALIIKSFRQILKQRKGKDYGPVWFTTSVATLCLTFLPKVSYSIRTTKLRQSVAHLATNQTGPTSPVPRRCATSVVSPVISLLNVHYLVIVTGATTRRVREEERRDTTRRRAAMPMFAGSGTPTRAPPTRTPQTSPSTKVFSSPTSATSASWQRKAR
jgi:hypothetical protein